MIVGSYFSPDFVSLTHLKGKKNEVFGLFVTFTPKHYILFVSCRLFIVCLYLLI